MLEIKAAREIRGKVDIPPSLDRYILSTIGALVSQKKTQISSVPDSPAAKAWTEKIAQLCAINIQKKTAIIEQNSENPQPTIDLTDLEHPYRDFILFSLLGMGKTVEYRDQPKKRIEFWKSLASKFGCSLKAEQPDGTLFVTLSGTDAFIDCINDISFDEIYPYIGCAWGLRKKIEAEITFQFSSILRPLLSSFGYELIVSSNLPSEKRGSLERRLRMLKKQKRTEGTPTSTLTADFSQSTLEEADIELPGDEVLTALLIAAKSIVQKGSLVMNNTPLAPWDLPIIDFLKKMGCRPGLQETGVSSFGPTGMLQLQNFDLLNRKQVCQPLCHYAGQLPAMIVITAFAEGQSVFRELEDMRSDNPDGIEEINECIRLLGARFGEMPDGIVIDGAHQFDGFDLQKEISVPCNGAFAMAGLKCMGTTSIADERIKKRWPDFENMLQSICQFRT